MRAWSCETRERLVNPSSSLASYDQSFLSHLLPVSKSWLLILKPPSSLRNCAVPSLRVYSPIVLLSSRSILSSYITLSWCFLQKNVFLNRPRRFVVSIRVCFQGSCPSFTNPRSPRCPRCFLAVRQTADGRFQ